MVTKEREGGTSKRGSKNTGARQEAVWSRGDCPKLLFGDAAMDCGLDGGPGSRIAVGGWSVSANRNLMNF